MFTYACGNIYIYDGSKARDEALQEAAEIEGGILAAAWAPN